MRKRHRTISWRQWLHVVAFLVQVAAIFILDLRTQIGVAAWLLYFIPMWYAMRFLRLGHLTVLKAAAIAGAFTALIALGFIYAAPGGDAEAGLVNRVAGVALLWFVALLLAWLTNRNRILSEADAALREKEVRLRQALDAAEMATWEWDLRAGTMRWGGLRELVVGLPPGSFGATYQDFHAVVHPDDRERVHSAWERAMRERIEYRGEYRFVHPDGVIRWIAGRGRFAYAGAEPVRMTGCCWDITDRKQAEESLRVSAERQRLLSEGVKNYGLFMLDPEGRVRNWNAGVESITGYRTEEILGHDYSCLYPDEERGTRQSHPRSGSGSGGGRYEHDDWRVRKDSSQFPANVVLMTMRDDTGSVAGFTVVMRDATMQRHAEEEVVHAVEPVTSSRRRAFRLLPQTLIRNLDCRAATSFPAGRRKK